MIYLRVLMRQGSAKSKGSPLLVCKLFGCRSDLRSRMMPTRIFGYPPDKQEKATRTVLEQAALLSEAWSVA